MIRCFQIRIFILLIVSSISWPQKYTQSPVINRENGDHENIDVIWELENWQGSIHKVKIIEPGYYIYDIGYAIQIIHYDILDNSYEILSTIATPPELVTEHLYKVSFITLVDSLAYIVLDHGGMWIIDISDYYNPQSVGSFYTGFNYENNNLVLDENIAYLSGNSSIWVLDISDLENITVLDHKFTPFLVGGGLTKWGDILYWGNDLYIYIIDVSNPSDTQLLNVVGFEEQWYYVNALEIFEDILIMGDGSNGLHIFDLNQDPIYLNETHFFEIDGSVTSLKISSDGLVVGLDLNCGIYLLDLQQLNDTFVTHQTINCNTTFRGFDFNASELVIARNWEGISIYNFEIPFDEIPELYTYSNYGEYLEVELSNNKLFAVNESNGIEIFDVSDPAGPYFLTKFTGDYNNIWKIHIIGDYAFIQTELPGFQILDISDINNIVQVGNFDPSETEYDILYPENFISYNDALYVTFDTQFLIFDIQDPVNPVLMNNFPINQIKGVPYINSNRMYFGLFNNELAIFDLSNPFYPEIIYNYDNTGYTSRYAIGQDETMYICSDFDVALYNIWLDYPTGPMPAGEIYFDSSSLEFQCTYINLNQNGNLVTLGTGFDGIRIIDVTSLFNPEQTGFYNTNGYVNDIEVGDNGYIYVADGFYGLYILGNEQLDVDDPVHPLKFSLGQNYPNPFNAATTIPFSVKEAGIVKIEIYNLLGEHVETLSDQVYLPGDYHIKWENPNLSSGIYIIKMDRSGSIYSRKCVYLK